MNFFRKRLCEGIVRFRFLGPFTRENLMKNRISAKARLASLLFSVVLVGATPVRSESPTPTPTPNPEAKHSLAEVAKEKELKGTEKGKGIVITNENLSEYAAKGGLTTATGTEGTGTNRRPVHQSGSASGAPVTVPPSGDTAREEERKRYWRSLYERQLNLVADIKHQIQVLDYEIPGLWRDFYSRDDPAYRDGVIKPKLDQALARSEQLEEQLKQEEVRLGEIKSEARKDGAQPGWFRDLKEPEPVPFTPSPEVGVIRD